ncbi:hypothetical protein POTOM_040087 [Populus tomentosa]|uniref:Uncharacterized protein n=1 Tax=Populus tomentosa TaxID=118781 RepID=A0A8X8CJZ3_POPTO|nr:hypothetical protein POTOM_040087 [Populus tomentosa]
MNLASELQSGLVTISAQVWLNQSLQNCHLKNEVNFFNSLGVSESCLGNLIRATYSLLGLRTHFASGEFEKRFSECTLCIHYLKEYFHILCRKQKLGPYFQVRAEIGQKLEILVKNIMLSVHNFAQAIALTCRRESLSKPVQTHDSPLIVMDYAFASKLTQISSSVTWKLSWKEVSLLPILKTRHPRLALLAGSFVITVWLSSNDLYTSMPLSTSLSKFVSSLAPQKLF